MCTLNYRKTPLDITLNNKINGPLFKTSERYITLGGVVGVPNDRLRHSPEALMPQIYCSSNYVIVIRANIFHRYKSLRFQDRPASSTLYHIPAPTRRVLCPSKTFLDPTQK